MNINRPLTALPLRGIGSLALLSAAVGVLLLGSPVGAQTPLHVTRYRNIVDQRFATVSDGPQSTVVLDVPANASTRDEEDVAERGAVASWKARAISLAPRLAALARANHGRREIIPISTLIEIRKGGRLVLPSASRARTRAVGGGNLTFTFTGFAATDQAFLQSVVNNVYPAIVSLYGAPAVSSTVEVVNAGSFDNSTIPEVQRAAFGSYDVSHNRILLPIFASNESFVQAFILNMIHAFHGPAVLQYDAWEQGFARAAAAIVARQTAGVVGISDPTASYLFSLLQFYDLLNQPALGNSTFFPSSQAAIQLDSTGRAGGMLVPRLGMSGAAWLKVYIENPDFFRQFNAAYYAQFDPNAQPSLAGNVPALRALAAPLLPHGVEGIDWNAWFQQQFILDTSASSGEHLYAFVIPGPFDPKSATQGQSTAIPLTYYIGQKNGDETLPANATAYATYFDSTNARISLGGAADSSRITNGEGSLTTLLMPTANSETGRITLDVHVGSVTTRSYFPSGYTGDFQAVVLGPNSAGDVTVKETSISAGATRNQTATVANSAFAVNLGTTSTDLGITAVSINSGGVTANYRVNTGDGQYYAVIRRGQSGGGPITVSHTFNTGDVPNLVTFPVRPLNPIVDQALGLAGSAFVLSYWNTQQNAYETSIPGQPSVTPLTTGHGYWFKLEPTAAGGSGVVTVTGIPPETDTDFTLNCPYGWNMIGSPFAQPIDLGNILIQYAQNGAISYPDAVARSLVAAQPFAWDPGTSAYQATSTLDGTNWQGYWLRVLVPGGVTLLLPGPDALTRAAHVGRTARGRAQASAPAVAAPDWSVRMRFQQGGSPMLSRAARVLSASAAFGVGRGVKPVGFDNRYDLEAPPAMALSASLHFPHKEWSDAKTTGRYVADYRSTVQGETTWNMDVLTPQTGTATLSWDGLGGVPRNTGLILLDPATGARTPLRSRSSYAFNAVAGQTRSFQIIAQPERSTSLFVSGVVTTPTRGTRMVGHSSGVNISYLVSSDAEVTVELLSLSGRTVRRLPAGRAATQARATVHWDGRGENGQPLPAGLYRLNISARADDGTQARFSQPILMLQ